MNLLLLFALLLVPAEQEILFEIQENPEDSVIIEGIFMGYSLGDYYHAVFTDENGDLFSAWAPTARTPGLGIFLFLYIGEPVEVTIVNVRTTIWEAGDIICAFVMDARAGEETYQDWYGSVSEEYGIFTQFDFAEHFGTPELDGPPFVEYVYLEETGASYRNVVFQE